MHKEVLEKTSKKREAAIRSHNRKTNVKEVNFTVGDYVLKGILRRQKGSKLALKWNGAYRVNESRQHNIFSIEDLLTGKVEEVHARRLKFFHNKDFKVTEEVKNHLMYQADELFVISRLDDLRVNKGVKQVLVAWKGFDDDERDWVDIDVLQENVPSFLQEFLEEKRKSGTKKQKKIAASIWQYLEL